MKTLGVHLTTGRKSRALKYKMVALKHNIINKGNNALDKPLFGPLM